MAAAGIVALETGIDRLAEDHANAKTLALGLQERFPGCCDPDIVETNLFHIVVSAFGMSGQELTDYLAQEGIFVFSGEPQMRLATHRMVTAEDIDQVLQAFDRLRAEQ
jgi:threonine aldolase